MYSKSRESVVNIEYHSLKKLAEASYILCIIFCHECLCLDFIHKLLDNSYNNNDSRSSYNHRKGSYLRREILNQWYIMKKIRKDTDQC